MFTLGRIVDPSTHALTATPLQYDPADLTTHAVCVGMTGSGKTGLCIDLLEEAALAGLPAILIDPKGDIANLLLQFPDLAPASFQPWVNVDEARRARLGLEDFARQKADEWRAGLAQWGLGPDDVQRLKQAVDWAVFTPGSDAGRPLSILKSLEAPALEWEPNQEMLRERIAGICSALLGLVGVEADPVKSREHILLANLFEFAWKNRQPLDLAGLINQVQAPPFPRLGVFEVERFFPEKDRLQLALALNAIVAAPSFQAWIQGEPLDIPGLLRAPDGRPRMSILYVAHLSEAERMFFITLLLEQVGAWLRGQSGTTSLRGLLYFDEVYGYFPPHPYNPPTKVPLMRLLKQARAFGLGVVLVTQNPGDLDYKGLTNTGTWFIGKLQTERDKARLLEGLETITSAAHAHLDVNALDTLITSLAPRTFLLHNVHAPGPQVFQTRWAMSYLAGPLTREQIRALAPRPVPAADTGGGLATPPPAVNRPAAASRAVPSTVSQYFREADLPLADAVRAWREQGGTSGAVFGDQATLVYHPALLSQAAVRYAFARAGVNEDRRFAFLVRDPQPGVVPHWSDHLIPPFSAAALARTPAPASQLAGDVPAALADDRRLAAWQRDLVGYLYRTADFSLHHNPGLKLYSRPGQSYEEFRAACQRAAEAQRDEALDKLRQRYDRKLDTLEDKLADARHDLKQDEAEVRAREDEARWTDVENVLGLVFRRLPYRTLSASTSKKRLAQRAKAELAESTQTIQALEAEITAVKAEAQQAFQAVVEKWNTVAGQIQDQRLTPKRADILVEVFGLGWLPHWRIEIDGQWRELPAYRS